MLAIAAIDYRYLIIPNELTAAALVLALINAAVMDAPMVEGTAIAVLRGLVTMAFFLSLRWIYAWLRQREGLGLGDVKLAFVAGAWLDWIMIPVAIEIAALGALIAYATWRTTGRQNIGTRLPFGLFLAPAIWLSWLTSALLGMF
ncbi:MAG: prepilin peptidase [Terriglobia bacterium]